LHHASLFNKLKPIIVIITGLSGSGKTVALRALEDSNFFCVDNLPVALIESFVAIVSKSREIEKIGIGIDIREKGFLSEISDALKTLRNKYQTRRPADLIRSEGLLKKRSGSKRKGFLS
jgi:UPF0042 nucleotide-binding protein